MAVHLTRIYTKTGDDGTTGLGDFSRVPKTEPRIAAYADAEECNAALGVALYNATLSTLDSFILPGGTPGAALLHVARVVCRRAERSAWTAIEADPERTSVLPAKYLNRLSDLLFILCRVANPDGDVKWVPGGERPSP